MSSSILIVGASMGGLRAAESLRRFGYDGDITVLGEERHLPYNRPPLSKDALANHVSHDVLAFPHRAATADVNWVVNTRVISADLNAQVVESETQECFPYSALIVATGLRARRLRVPNRELAGRHALRTLEDAASLQTELGPDIRVVIAGAGFIGCEVAATARTLGCDVTVVGSTDYPMERPLGVELAKELRARHEARGVQFEMNSRVVDVLGKERVSGVRLLNGRVLPADVVVEAIGSDFNTEWLSGNDVDISHGILTDSAMRAIRADGTPWENVFAVGDVARFPNALYGTTAYAIEHWNIPLETAKRAGKVLALQMDGGGDLDLVLMEPFAPLPSFWSDQYEIHLLAYGLLEQADRIEVIQGELGADCVLGYFRRERMLGVCGIGMKSVVMKFRESLAALP